jgi:hypothetical protein
MAKREIDDLKRVYPDDPKMTSETDMKNETLIQKMLAAGLDSALAEKAFAAGFTLTKLRNATKKALEAHFYQGEVERIRERLQRKPIDEAVIRELVDKCDWSCCVCWKVDERQPIIIHHIEEHSKTADDSYANLVVLCLNCHGKAHSRWEISRHPVDAVFIKSRKAEFEKAIAEFKAGSRAAPGREGDRSDPASHTDVEALRRLADFLSRPAVFKRFDNEGNMMEFLTAMADISRAMNTGILKTRDGDELGRTKHVRNFSNPQWRERLDLVNQQFDAIRTRVQLAIRGGELDVNPQTGWYCFHNRHLPLEIDAVRRAAAMLFNTILHQAGIEPIRAPDVDRY